MTSDSSLWRIMAVVISVALHALFFFQFGGTVSIAPSQQQASQPRVTRIHLIASPKAPGVAIADPDSAKPEPAPPTPKPVLRAVQREHAKPKSKSLKSRQVDKLRRVANTAHIQHVEKKSASIAQPTIPRAAVASAPVKQTSVDEGLVARERLKYMAKVMAHIERHKYYPPTARRRGIQGNVHIRFLLLADGSTQQLMVEGVSSVLQKAAKKAVIKAIPMPKPPTGIHCPMHCEFAMRYALK